MTKSDPWAEAAESVLERRRRAADEPVPSEEQLIALLRGELPDESADAEEVRRFAVLHPEILAAVQESLAGPAEPAVGDPAYLTPEQFAADRAALEHRLGLGATSAPTHRIAALVTERPQRSIPWLAIAAGLGWVAVGGFALHLRQELTATRAELAQAKDLRTTPRVLLPLAIDPDGVRSGTPQSPIALALGAADLVLAVPLPKAGPAVRFTVSFSRRGPAGPELLWRREELSRPVGGVVVVEMERSQVPPGLYELQVRGAGPDGRLFEDTFTLRAE